MMANTTCSARLLRAGGPDSSDAAATYAVSAISTPSPRRSDLSRVSLALTGRVDRHGRFDR